MTLKEQLFQKLETLLPEEQEAVIQFVDFLQFRRNLQKPQEISLRPLKSLKGLWANLPIDITEEEITEARHQMWDFSTDIEL
ncbi:MAG: hypothetical protein KME05_10840 [Gloeocapsa sp. UFS-A4-WI-NPMV-4B04]|jgi:hypothetical protein|nr:hypothetical protein [Gloeocapsa sp. UFS-A4-WI-NPMV-4B04]